MLKKRKESFKLFHTLYLAQDASAQSKKITYVLTRSESDPILQWLIAEGHDAHTLGLPRHFADLHYRLLRLAPGTALHPGLSFWANDERVPELCQSLGLEWWGKSAEVLALTADRFLLKKNAPAESAFKEYFFLFGDHRDLEKFLSEHAPSGRDFMVSSLRRIPGEWCEFIFTSDPGRGFKPWFDYHRRFSEYCGFLVTVLPRETHFFSVWIPEGALRSGNADDFLFLDQSLRIREKVYVEYTPGNELRAHLFRELQPLFAWLRDALHLTGGMSLHFLRSEPHVRWVDVSFETPRAVGVAMRTGWLKERPAPALIFSHVYAADFFREASSGGVLAGVKPPDLGGRTQLLWSGDFPYEISPNEDLPWVVTLGASGKNRAGAREILSGLLESIHLETHFVHTLGISRGLLKSPFLALAPPDVRFLEREFFPAFIPDSPTLFRISQVLHWLFKQWGRAWEATTMLEWVRLPEAPSLVAQISYDPESGMGECVEAGVSYRFGLLPTTAHRFLFQWDAQFFWCTSGS